MPVPFTPDSPATTGSRTKGFHLPSRQPYANETVRRSHIEALYAFGEFSMFVLMWDIDDLHEGRVERCSLCYGGAKVDSEVAEVFNQPTLEKCPSCFGTTFEGGYKARIVRVSFWDYSEEAEDSMIRGTTTSQTAVVQTTHDFHMRDGDFIFRSDGTRWQINGGGLTNRIRDGFGMPTRDASGPGFQYSDCRREEDTSVAYMIPPPTRTELQTILGAPPDPSGAWGWTPPDFSEYEEIRGPINDEIFND